MQVSLRGDLDVLYGDVVALDELGRRPDLGARVARRRREDDDEPRRFGPGEVRPVDLTRRSVVCGPRGGVWSLPLVPSTSQMLSALG